jgi:hypothetical protein
VNFLEKIALRTACKTAGSDQPLKNLSRCPDCWEDFGTIAAARAHQKARVCVKRERISQEEHDANTTYPPDLEAEIGDLRGWKKYAR